MSGSAFLLITALLASDWTSCPISLLGWVPHKHSLPITLRSPLPSLSSSIADGGDGGDDDGGDGGDVDDGVGGDDGGGDVGGGGGGDHGHDGGDDGGGDTWRALLYAGLCSRNSPFKD